METIGNRIILLREALGKDGRKMSQTEFGKKIGLTQTGVAAIENNKNGASESAILNIVREFHVNETWLRTGEGEIFLPTTREGEIADFINRTVTGPDNVKKRLIFALSQLDESDWATINKTIDLIAGKKRKGSRLTRNPGTAYNSCCIK